LTTFAPAQLSAPWVLLEDRLTPETAGGRLYENPHAIVRCDDPADVGPALGLIEQGIAQGLHAAGFFAYELGYAVEPKLARLTPARLDTPLLWFGLFDPPQRLGADVLDAAFAALGPPPPLRLRKMESREAHMARVERALELIAAGDVYQVNLTFPIRFRYDSDPLRLYGALRARQPVAYGGVIVLGDLSVLSVSPELWVETTGDQATTKPMKGTHGRGADRDDDEAARERLAADPKQRAENLMIVDLLRNDLARISLPGTVHAPALFTVETYPSFHTLTSTVVGQLRPGVSLQERIAGLFPCGSIVGAPKIRAAEVIRALEAEPRGVYTGAMGAIAPGGDMRFNVAIRTAVVKSDAEGRYGVGGGIVADSDPGGEYDEALLKARVLTDLAHDFGLIETFRWSPAHGYVRLPMHLDRLARSARNLGFAFDRFAAEEALRRRGAGWTAVTADQRVRLLLEPDGRLEITNQPLLSSPGDLRVGVATHRLDPGDPFQRHKTTRRDVYEHAFQAARAADLDEAIFLNRRGEVAEATRNSVFVEIGGVLHTPPLCAGVLPGILRQHLLETGKALEASISADRLNTHRIWLGNSLYGLRTATLVAPKQKNLATR
jgi:para-aminobenzoate synthetase/4-amino-4-deoxychorismate lyase